MSANKANGGVWVIIGGRVPGVFAQSTVLLNRPHIPCGYRTPPLPVAIKCRTPEEVHEVYTTLEPIATHLTPTMLPVKAARCFYKLTLIAHVLEETVSENHKPPLQGCHIET
ncbi:hypothetical protein PAXRUDRAFT_143812 [Paxillus rubicundulus Ve08.2h10]|uniref:Uncharacterized protein n=1 Tax=Paxillus rubicundulus Ve08.2h10 TaxID=930991 RepID=A0A0D0E1A7_9AGAM|nr:hypothetical protein PAXRUDRAFT_143812 [Paxillus rubicundulus Ve08.2h10]